MGPPRNLVQGLGNVNETNVVTRIGSRDGSAAETGCRGSLSESTLAQTGATAGVAPPSEAVGVCAEGGRGRAGRALRAVRWEIDGNNGGGHRKRNKQIGDRISIIKTLD